MMISVKALTVVATAFTPSSKSARTHPKTTQFAASTKITSPSTCNGALLMKAIITTIKICKTATVTSILTTKVTTTKTCSRNFFNNSSNNIKCFNNYSKL